MRVSRPFHQLPIRFSSETLAREVNALPPEAWTPHPQGYRGNDAVALVSPGGGINDDMSGAMAATEYLRSCPYIIDIMEQLGGVWGRSRLMGLGAGAEVPVHVDVHYYWRTHLRLHIPIVTNPGVRFTCGDETIHMAPGECWAFDSFRRHRVENTGIDKRIHLVLDTAGNERIWELLEQSKRGIPPAEPTRARESVAIDSLAFEKINAPLVMSPWEMQSHLDYLIEHAVPNDALQLVTGRLRKFIAGWTGAWSQFGTGEQGIASYRALIDAVRPDLHALGGTEIRLDNGELFLLGVEALMFWNAIARDRQRVGTFATSSPHPEPLATSQGQIGQRQFQARIERPIFIVSSPRSGSTLLFDTLAQAPDLFSVGGESHALIERISALSVPSRGWTSNRLTAQDASPEVNEELARGFYGALRDRQGHAPQETARMLEKTPKNSLRVPFFNAVWPDSSFVFLYRDPRQTLSSMIEAWLSGRFRTYPLLPGWSGAPWSLLLVPGWEQLVGMPLPEIIANQWAITLGLLVSDLYRLPRERVVGIDYDELVDQPQATMERLSSALGLGWDRTLDPKLPISAMTVSRPGRDKWKQAVEVIESVWPIVEQADSKAREFLDKVHI